MNGMEMGLWFGMVVGFLFVFGVAFNLLIGWVERQGWLDGFTALAVVVGVGVTLLAAGILIGFEDVLVVLVCFAASGAPMVLGSWWRYVNRRSQERVDIRDIVRGIE